MGFTDLARLKKIFMLTYLKARWNQWVDYGGNTLSPHLSKPCRDEASLEWGGTLRTRGHRDEASGVQPLQSRRHHSHLTLEPGIACSS